MVSFVSWHSVEKAQWVERSGFQVILSGKTRSKLEPFDHGSTSNTYLSNLCNTISNTNCILRFIISIFCIPVFPKNVIIWSVNSLGEKILVGKQFWPVPFLVITFHSGGLVYHWFISQMGNTSKQAISKKYSAESWELWLHRAHSDGELKILKIMFLQGFLNCWFIVARFPQLSNHQCRGLFNGRFVGIRCSDNSHNDNKQRVSKYFAQFFLLTNKGSQTKGFRNNLFPQIPPKIVKYNSIICIQLYVKHDSTGQKSESGDSMDI